MDPFPYTIRVDVNPSGGASDLNGVLDPGETVLVEPGYYNVNSFPVSFPGTFSNFTGPSGATYTIIDGAGSYALPALNWVYCSDCYVLSLDDPSPRPAAHWDTIVVETTLGGLLGPIVKPWTLHVGGSFADVSRSASFYPFIETLFHNEVTGGCGGGDYCPGNSVTRAQMAVFLLKAEHGSAYVPPTCIGTFADVTCPSLFADWIEELAAEGITTGCGGNDYCPDDAVTRRQMAVFLLKAAQGSDYTPPAAAGIFDDVPPGDAFAPWIEDLYNRQITAGCLQTPPLYCPAHPNNRGQMAVFLVKTFGLPLY